ncbi:hypothetical protein NYO98_04870 [Nocardioides sp. STR2]|uniref:Uncharacterized protein n=1 Tax=Nocardioides pini TaxID=2975053 RepID=A0ABT4C9F3_9ACTN|nr:hypothetical protein [Nocardioides pini]MCY4725603.1 hypothetical protein [Nocardioides pini]
MNPIRLVSGAVTLPAHAAAAVIGTSVGIATTGVRTTARVVGRVIEQVSGSRPTPPAPWPADRPASTEVDPVTGAGRSSTSGPDTALDTAPEAPPVTVPAAKKAPAKKAPAKKAAAKKGAARKTAPRRASSEQAAVLAPALGLSEAEVEAELDAGTTDDITTPSGIPAAGEGVNPDTTETDLHQPGTEPLMDPGTVKSVASESQMLQRAADTDKG